MENVYFEVVYDTRPHSLINLTPSSDRPLYSANAERKAKEIKMLQEQIRERIKKHNSRYKAQCYKHQRQQIFKVQVQKERFLNQPNAKLSPRADDPFKLVQKINHNAYKVELSRTYDVSATLNITDLSPYLDDETKLNSRFGFVQLGKDDPDKPTSHA